MAENKMNSVELTDEELETVQGGFDVCRQDGHFYKYVGTDPDQKYLCPNCGGPVHEGTGWRFYCDACDESWFLENRLNPNLASGSWSRISRAEYERRRSLLNPR